MGRFSRPNMECDTKKLRRSQGLLFGLVVKLRLYNSPRRPADHLRACVDQVERRLIAIWPQQPGQPIDVAKDLDQFLPNLRGDLAPAGRMVFRCIRIQMWHPSNPVLLVELLLQA